MGTEQAQFHIRRAAMVKQQLKKRGITDLRVLNAFNTVPREAFVPVSLQDLAYDDRPLPIGEGQTISQPFVVAAMMQLLDLRPSDRVLEVGAGSGYAAAILAMIVAEVYALERLAPLARRAARRLERLEFANVHLAHGDGTMGWPEHAPFDGILVSAGGPAVPPVLREQLAPGGRLIMPVGPESRRQTLVLVTRTAEGGFESRSYGRVAFVPLIGGELDQSST